VTPGSTRNVFTGQAAVMDLSGDQAPDAITKSPAAMVALMGESGAAVAGGSRASAILRMREMLEDARDYAANRTAFNTAQRREYVRSRLDLEALQPVLKGQEPLLVQANRASDVLAAVRLGREFNVRVVVMGGAEAWMVADQLAAAKVPVLTGAMNNIPMSFTSLGQRQENAGLLRQAGVAVALIGNTAGGGDEETFNARNIRYEAGNAVAYGMSWDDALRAVTLAPAQIFGVADRVGSLQPGREGNVVVWSGDPFEFATVAEHVFVRGREYNEPTRQDLLTQRYKNLPPKYEGRP
jgi:imidazolonepropionase-like amidohydrolase